MIDQTFRNIIKLFVLSFNNGNNDPTRDSFNKYYMTLVEIKDFNALINNKPFSNQPVKNKQETYEKLIEMSRNDNYLHHQNYHKLIAKDLPIQTNTTTPQQNNFARKLEDDGSVMFFIAQKQQKAILNVFFRFIVIE